MFCNEGDYVIAQIGKKRFLVHVQKIKEKLVKGIQEAGRPYVVESVGCEVSDVIANLGQEPRPGRAFGCEITPFRRTVQSTFWGNIHFYRKISKDDWKVLKAGLVEARAWLTEEGLTSLTPISIEIRPPKGKIGGWWLPASKNREHDTMGIIAPKFDEDTMYPIITHELGHGIWGNLLPDRLKAEWLSLYRELITLNAITQDYLDKLCEEYITAKVGTKAFAKNLEGQQEEIFKSCILYIRRSYNFSISHLDIMNMQDEESIREVWPTTTELREITETITEYATKNAEELFSEAVSLYSDGVKLPKTMRSLLEKSLQVCRDR